MNRNCKPAKFAKYGYAEWNSAVMSSQVKSSRLDFSDLTWLHVTSVRISRHMIADEHNFYKTISAPGVLPGGGQKTTIVKGFGTKLEPEVSPVEFPSVTSVRPLNKQNRL